jgi:hypothetical protein
MGLESAKCKIVSHALPEKKLKAHYIISDECKSLETVENSKSFLFEQSAAGGVLIMRWALRMKGVMCLIPFLKKGRNSRPIAILVAECNTLEAV